MNSREISVPRQRPDRVQIKNNFSLPDNEQERVKNLLTTTIADLDRHAIPDARIQNISHIQLKEPEHLRIQGDVAPALHYMDIHNATFADGVSKTEIVTCGRVVTLHSQPDKPLNNWSVVRPGETEGKSISHLEILNFLQARIEDSGFDFIPKEFKTQPITDDQTVVNHLLNYCKGLTDRHDDTRYYNATSCSFEHNPVTNSEYFAEIDAGLSVVDTKSSRTYISHLSFASTEENSTDGKSYDYRITERKDRPLTTKQNGRFSFNGQHAMSTTRINEVTSTDFNYATITKAIRDTASLVKNSHFESSDDNFSIQELL